MKKNISILFTLLAFLSILPVNNAIANSSYTNRIIVETDTVVTAAAPLAGITLHGLADSGTPVYPDDLFPLRRGEYVC